MPLVTQTLAIQLQQGVDTKSDPKAVVAGKLLVLENGSLRAPGSIRKRNGFARALSRSILGSTGSISVGQALATYRSELLLADPAQLYSYNPGSDAWVAKGAFVSAYVTNRPVVRNTYAQSAQDSTTHPSGLQVFAWEDSQGGVRYSAIDTSTGAVVVNDTLVDAAGSRPKVLAVGNYAVILWANGANLYYAPIVASVPQTLGAPVLVTSALAGSAYDAEVIGQRLFVAYGTSTGFSTVYYDSTLHVGSTVSVATTSPTALSVFMDSGLQNVCIAWCDGAGVRLQVRDYSLANTWMPTTAVEGVAAIAVTGVSIPGSTSKIRLFYELSSGATYNHYVRTVAVNGYAVQAPGVLLRSVGLAAKAFLYNSTPYVPLAYQSALQSSYFIADASGNLVAKILAGLGGGLPTRAVLAESNALTDPSQFQFSFLAKYRLSTEGGAVFTLAGVNSVVLDFFDPENSYAHAELGLGLHLGGGFPALYDGASVVEHGFHLYPENVSVANLDADAGTTQTYGYQVVYAWTDNQGQIHRSSPSVAVSWQKLNKIDGTHRTTVTIPTLRLTGKQSPRRTVICEIYRTIANGTLYYLASSSTAPVYNDTTVDTVTFTDAVTDATLQGNPQLYTTGEVENIAPGPVSAMAVHQNRIVALDSENPLTLWWSKPVVPGSPVQFSDLLKQNVDAVGGDITAIARMDAWLIIFKRTAIFATNEEGPAANGGAYVFSSGQQIPSNVGCVNPRSVNLNQNGITFQSDKGWHLLDRSLQVRNIGELEGWKGEVATSALTMPNTHESRFTCASGIALVNDDFVDQWGTFTNVQAVDSVIWQGLHTYLRPDGQARQETPGVFSDAGKPIKLRVKTSWLQLAGVSGFQRVKRFVVLGDYLSAHKLICSIGYDFNPEPSQIATIDAAGELAQPVYGADSVYGGAAVPADSLVYGGQFPAYAWRISTKVQKCTAIQITLEDSQTVAGEGCSFASLAFIAGMKPGVRRLGPQYTPVGSGGSDA